MNPVLQGLKPTHIWKHFDEIRKIPHGSGNEHALGEYIKKVAQELDYSYEQDNIGNIVILKPATTGHEGAETVILQGHLDMVCEKNSDVMFDFEKDSIQLKRNGDWITAKGTTLGADNGIGVAAELAVLEDDTLIHGPLELFFTVDEETGLTGASKVASDFLTGRIFLNLDGEEDGEFYIGCAGGADSEFTLNINRTNAPQGKWLKVKLSGLKGGHSGVDIHEGRGNAIKLLNRILWQTFQEVDFSLVSIKGGSKRNAIPREVFAEIIVSDDRFTAFKNNMNKISEEIKFEFKAIEQDINLSFEQLSGSLPPIMDSKSQQTLMSLLFALPHGVLAMSHEIEDLVETSTNLAIIETEHQTVKIIESSRSSVNSALQTVRDKLKAFAQLVEADINQPEGYPGWTPNLESPILATMKEVHKNLFGREPNVVAIHAGLECGIIGKKFPGMDTISFGPTIKNPHSPDERVHTGSVEKFWKLLITALQRLS